jgi:ferredoxin
MSPLPVTSDAPRPTAPAAPVEASGPLGRERLETLRRFHTGDPAAAAPAPPGLLPASLHGFRGQPVRTSWPLLVDPDPGAGSFAVTLADALAAVPTPGRTLLDEHRVRLERRLRAELGPAAPAGEALRAAARGLADEIALPAAECERLFAAVTSLAETLAPNAQLVGFDRRAPLLMAHLAARRRLTSARAALAAEIHELALVAESLLAADAARRPLDTAPEARLSGMGSLGGQLIDPSRLSAVVARRRAGNPLADERRARLEAAHALLTGFDHTLAEPLWIVAHSEFGPPSGGTLRPHVRTAVDPCRAAAAAFDELAADVLDLVRAIRTVRLEAADAFEPERHPGLLAALDWHGFTREELALVPPVLVAMRERDLGLGSLPSLSRLLLSGRALHVLLVVEEDLGAGTETSEPRLAAEPSRLELGYLAIGHRRAFVQQASVAFPLPFAQALVRALDAGRPSLHVLDAPTSAPDDLDPWLVASARVSGRAAPLLAYDPTAGETWARRLRFVDNPEPAADWPREVLPPAARALGGGELASFTYADAALLDPGWQRHFAPVTEAGDELAPIADWLALAPEEAAQKLPYVWSLDREGHACRLVVSRALAAATRDRLDFWRTLEELAGVRNEHVEEAVDRARREERLHAERERQALAARHADELTAVRRDAEAVAVERLVSTVFAVAPAIELPAAGGPSPRLAAITSAPAASLPTVTEAAGGPSAAAATAAATPIAPVATADDEPADAWIDTALCTSCDECIRKSPNVFAYNADKQAYVKDPRGSSYRELVLAAEACTAKIIHVGTPWNPAEPDLATWLERGRKFR